MKWVRNISFFLAIFFSFLFSSYRQREMEGTIEFLYRGVMIGIVILYLFSIFFDITSIKNIKKYFTRLLPLLIFYLYSTLKIGYIMDSNGIERKGLLINLFHYCICWIILHWSMDVSNSQPLYLYQCFIFTIATSFLFNFVIYCGFEPLTGILGKIWRSRAILGSNIRTWVYEGAILENFNIILTPLSIIIALSFYRCYKLTSVILCFLGIIFHLLAFKRIYLLTLPVMFIVFLLINNKATFAKYYFLILLGCLVGIIIILTLSDGIYEKWVERLGYIENDVATKVRWTYFLLTSLSEKWIFGRDEVAYVVNTKPPPPFLLVEPSFAFFVYLTGIFGLSLFVIMHLSWLRNLIKNFNSFKTNSFYLFSLYTFIFITLTLFLYHYLYIRHLSMSCLYWLGYLFSFFIPPSIVKKGKDIPECKS